MTRIVPAFSETSILPSGVVTTEVGKTNHCAISSVSKPGALAANVGVLGKNESIPINAIDNEKRYLIGILQINNEIRLIFGKSIYS
jgi:hypothetical protein